MDHAELDERVSGSLASAARQLRQGAPRRARHSLGRRRRAARVLLREKGCRFAGQRGGEMQQELVLLITRGR